MAAKIMSKDQKAKMAQGRRETRVVETYLRQLENRSKKTRRSAEEIAKELDRVDGLLPSASGIDRLSLLQEREDLQRQALEAEPEDDGAIEEQFIAVATSYSERKGISYSTWREFGVSKDVLEAAGISRTRRPNQSRA